MALYKNLSKEGSRMANTLHRDLYPEAEFVNSTNSSLDEMINPQIEQKPTLNERPLAAVIAALEERNAALLFRQQEGLKRQQKLTDSISDLLVRIENLQSTLNNQMQDNAKLKLQLDDARRETKPQLPDGPSTQLYSQSKHLLWAQVIPTKPLVVETIRLRRPRTSNNSD
jgi:hypothetical protein